MNIMVRERMTSQTDDDFTDRVYALDNRRIYKGVPEEPSATSWIRSSRTGPVMRESLRSRALKAVASSAFHVAWALPPWRPSLVRG